MVSFDFRAYSQLNKIRFLKFNVIYLITNILLLSNAFCPYALV